MLGALAVVVLIAAAAVLLGSGTGVGAGSVIDGWTIGAAATCSDGDPERPCSALLPVARTRLDVRDPGHLPVVTSELRNEQVNARSSILYIAVFKLADGSLKAIGVWYPGVSTTPGTLDYGPGAGSSARP
ncbi:MAG TPA: hypothetical protein VF484_09800 [Candidatus Limnocylindrales bacterium]